MCFRYLLIVFCVFNCYASDKSISDLEHDRGFQTFIMGALTLGGLYQDWQLQSHVQNDLIIETHNASTDEKCIARFAHSRSQRMVAVDRQKAILWGVANFTKFIIRPDLPFTIRSEINPISAVESALLPITVYLATKPTVDAVAFKCSEQIRFLIAASLALSLPHAIVATGTAPHRILYNSLMHYAASNSHLFGNVAGIKHAAASLSYGSKVMPLVQMGISTVYKKPSLLTVHPVILNGELHKWKDLQNGLLPGLILAGVDLSFTIVAATPVGAAIESVVDAGIDRAIKPLPEKTRPYVRRSVKKAIAEGTKIGITVGACAVAESQGCVMQ